MTGTRGGTNGVATRVLRALGWVAIWGAGCSTGVHAQDPTGLGTAGSSGEFPPLDNRPMDAGARAAGPPSAKVRMVFKTVPPTQATVTWGKKRLGIIKPKYPLIIERPRDSGPLDVVVHAEGCLPVHSRVYTFTDTVLSVKVTPPDKKNTLFGYREAPPPEEDAGIPAGPAPDSGVVVGVPP
jgi:hypothetical protein